LVKLAYTLSMSEPEMSSGSVHVGYADGACRHTRNLASTAWVIYSPSGQLLSSGGSCLGPATNNLAEYSAVIELLVDAIHHGIDHLIVRLDSQLVVSHLNGVYHIRNPFLLRKYLRIKLLERQFQFITYEHIPRNLNHVSDAFANYVLDWHLRHNQ
jgi:ribonuclease HI